MADERDPEVSSAYRALGAEEPPRALDDAILAAARREAGARPALAGRAGRNRWYAPLATAAVLVLAVAVTLHTQVEQPDLVEPAPPARQAQTQPAPIQPAPARAEAAKEPPKSAPAPKASKPAETAKRAEPAPFPATTERAMAEARIPPAPQPAASAAPPAAPSSRADDARDSAAGASTQALAKRSAARESVAPDTPERELERIAGLRAQGRHDEADKALAEFHKRYADYRIPEEMRARVERR